jgi:hypothetical protein
MSFLGKPSIVSGGQFTEPQKFEWVNEKVQLLSDRKIFIDPRFTAAVSRLMVNATRDLHDNNKGNPILSKTGSLNLDL